MNLLDLIVIAIIAFATYRGYKNGFIKSIFSVISVFIAIAITFAFYKPVMIWIKENTGFESWTRDYLYTIDFGKTTNNQLESGELASGDSSSGEVIASTSYEADNYLNSLSQTVKDIINIDELKENAKEVVIQKIVDFVMKLFSMIIVYIIAKLILKVIILVLDTVAKLPVLKQFNELLGLIFGVVLGVLQVDVICAIISLLSALPVAQGLVNMINTSVIAKILYDNNLLLQLLF